MVAFAQSLTGGNIGEVSVEAVVATITSILHICFWVTLIFAIMERTGIDLGLKLDVD